MGKPLFYEILEKPATSCVIGLCSVIWFYIQKKNIGYSHVGLSYETAVEPKSYSTCFNPCVNQWRWFILLLPNASSSSSLPESSTFPPPLHRRHPPMNLPSPTPSPSSNTTALNPDGHTSARSSHPASPPPSSPKSLSNSVTNLT
ncbi:hypothetical protein L1987_08694 [Smallanthus sonchifolius]|uniref:Uncharacterized protein n=1 Tax=Smallanthus sonchifolius TaxID=185202 RepID=A0ACB9JLB5_9ASTR|nr:hypothetical protein L1987_08694 [Smallanthus sonchifolius]